MPNLNDLQSILLATAAQRDSGSLYPLAESATKAGARLPRALGALKAAGFAEERESSDPATTSRTDGDLQFGLFITAAGLAAIGIGEAPTGPPPATVEPADGTPTPRTSKTADVVTLLQRNEGATLADLIAATSWLPHTTRAALTGLRKKGHVITRGKRDDVTCYKIAAAVEA